MTDQCERLRDRMPRVAAAGQEWSAEEAVHLGECPDCADEWRLVQAAGRLGASVGRRVNPVRLSAAVLAGVARDRQVVRWRRAGWLTGLAAAAALTLIVWRGRTPGTVPAGDSTAAVYLLPLAELEALDEGQLQAVLEALDAPLQEGTSAGGPTLNDLDDIQLERVLRSLEG